MKLIRNSVTKRAVTPTKIIQPGERTVLNIETGLKVVLRVVGGHAGNDVLINIPRTATQPGIAMIIDVLTPRWAPFAGLSLTESIVTFIKVHKVLMKLDFTYFVGGHLRVGDKSDVADSLRYVESLIEAAKNAKTSVTPKQLSDVKRDNFLTPGTTEYKNVWFVGINAGINLEAKNCAREMIKKWGCRFGGVATTAFYNCFVSSFYVTGEY